MCAFTQDNDNYYVNPWLRTCAFSASRIYIYSPEDENEDSGLVLFSLSLFGGSVAGFMRLWLVFCFGGGFSSGYVQSLGGGEMGGVAGVRWLRSSSKCAHVLQPEMVVSEAHHLSRSRWPLSLARIKVALLLSLGFFFVFLYFRLCFLCLSIVLQHFAHQIKEEKTRS